MKKAEITTPSATNSLLYDRSPSRDLRRELWIWVPQDVGPYRNPCECFTSAVGIVLRGMTPSTLSLL